MSRSAALLFVLIGTGCAEEPYFGNVRATHEGQGRVALMACLDADLLSCYGEDVALEAAHLDTTVAMPYSTALFASGHHATLDLVDRDAPFFVRDVSDGEREVEMSLPRPFELAVSPAPPVGPDDDVEVSWQGASAPMRWAVGYTCDRDVGSVTAGGIDDDGAITLRMADVMRVLHENDDIAATCTIHLTLSRISYGCVDGGFRAEGATGIERREIEVVLRP